MGKFAHSVKFEDEFDGDKVTVVSAPATFEQALKYQESSTDTDDIKVLYDIVKENNRSFQGVTDKDGVPVSLDMAMANAYYLPLIASIGKQIIKEAFPDRPKKPVAISES